MLFFVLIERANKKRGINADKKAFKYENEETESDSTIDINQIQQVFITETEERYGISKEDKNDFCYEASQFKEESKTGDYSLLNDACSMILDMVNHFFEEKTELTEIEEKELYGCLLRLRLITTKFSSVKLEEIKCFIPALIKLLEPLIKYPNHLDQLLSILINYSSLQNIEESFIIEEYKLIESIQDILGEYSYSPQNAGIIEGVYWLLGNLMIESTEICRNMKEKFYTRDFMSHIGYLLNKRDELLESTADIISYTLKCLVTKDFDSTKYKYFVEMIKDLELMLSYDNESVVSDVLYIFRKLLRFLYPVSSELIQKVVNLLEFNDPLVKANCLKLICKILEGSKDNHSFLIDINICSALRKVLCSEKGEFNSEVLKCLEQLSNAKEEDLFNLYQAGFVHLLVSFMRLNSCNYQVESLKSISNVLQNADYDICNNLLGDGLLKDLDCLLGKNSSQDLNYYALLSIYNFLSKDNEDKLFAIEFDSIGGVDTIEKLQDFCPDKHYQIIKDILIKFFNADENEFTFMHDSIDVARHDKEMVF